MRGNKVAKTYRIVEFNLTDTFSEEDMNDDVYIKTVQDRMQQNALSDLFALKPAPIPTPFEILKRFFGIGG